MNCNITIYCPDGNSGFFAVSQKDLHGGDAHFPMGKIALGETPVAAVIRILKEQTGCTTDVGKIKIVYQNHYNDELNLVYHIDYRTLQGPTNASSTKIIDWFPSKSLMTGHFAVMNKDIFNNL